MAQAPYTHVCSLRSVDIDSPCGRAADALRPAAGTREHLAALTLHLQHSCQAALRAV
jgi:hypothetical protein